MSEILEYIMQQGGSLVSQTSPSTYLTPIQDYSPNMVNFSGINPNPNALFEMINQATRTQQMGRAQDIQMERLKEMDRRQQEAALRSLVKDATTNLQKAGKDGIPTYRKYDKLRSEVQRVGEEHLNAINQARADGDLDKVQQLSLQASTIYTQIPGYTRAIEDGKAIDEVHKLSTKIQGMANAKRSVEFMQVIDSMNKYLNDGESDIGEITRINEKSGEAYTDAFNIAEIFSGVKNAQYRDVAFKKEEDIIKKLYYDPEMKEKTVDGQIIKTAISPDDEELKKSFTDILTNMGEDVDNIFYGFIPDYPLFATEERRNDTIKGYVKGKIDVWRSVFDNIRKENGEAVAKQIKGGGSKSSGKEEVDLKQIASEYTSKIEKDSERWDNIDKFKEEIRKAADTTKTSQEFYEKVYGIENKYRRSDKQIIEHRVKEATKDITERVIDQTTIGEVVHIPTPSQDSKHYKTWKANNRENGESEEDVRKRYEQDFMGRWTFIRGGDGKIKPYLTINSTEDYNDFVNQLGLDPKKAKEVSDIGDLRNISDYRTLVDLPKSDNADFVNEIFKTNIPKTNSIFADENVKFIEVDFKTMNDKNPVLWMAATNMSTDNIATKYKKSDIEPYTKNGVSFTGKNGEEMSEGLKSLLAIIHSWGQQNGKVGTAWGLNDMDGGIYITSIFDRNIEGYNYPNSKHYTGHAVDFGRNNALEEALERGPLGDLIKKIGFTWQVKTQEMIDNGEVKGTAPHIHFQTLTTTEDVNKESNPPDQGEVVVPQPAATNSSNTITNPNKVGRLN